MDDYEIWDDDEDEDEEEEISHHQRVSSTHLVGSTVEETTCTWGLAIIGMAQVIIWICHLLFNHILDLKLGIIGTTERKASKTVAINQV